MKKDDLDLYKNFFVCAIRNQDIPSVSGILASICLSKSNQKFLLCEPIDGGFTALMLAVTSGDPECVKAILEALEKVGILQAALQAKKDGGFTALMLAVTRGDPECVKAILQSVETKPEFLQSILQAKKAGGCTALMLAVTNGDPECVKAILQSVETKPEFLLSILQAKKAGGFTALMHAAGNKKPACVKAILQSVETKPELLKSILQATDDDGSIALMHAAGNKKPACVKAILEALEKVGILQAALQAKKDGGFTALMLARSPQCMDLLLEASGLENFESFIDFVQETPASKNILHLCNHFLQSHSKQSAAPEPEPEMESSERGTIELDLLQLLAYQIESACAIKQLYHPLFLTSEGVDAYEAGLKRCNLLCPTSLFPIKQPIPLNFIGDRESLESEDAGRALSG